ASALAILAEAPPDADFPEMFREELQECRQSLSGPAADIAKVLRHEVDVADVAKPIREAAESIEQWLLRWKPRVRSALRSPTPPSPLRRRQLNRSTRSSSRATRHRRSLRTAPAGSRTPLSIASPDRRRTPMATQAEKRRSIAEWDALVKRYPLGSRWDFWRQLAFAALSNAVTVYFLVTHRMQPIHLVYLVALEALLLTAIAWIQTIGVPQEARFDQQAQPLGARLGTLAFGL